MEDRIFIVDIEAPKLRHEQLREFFSFMFLRKDIIKIGEDLCYMSNIRFQDSNLPKIFINYAMQ